MGIFDRLKKKTQTTKDVGDFIEIPVDNIIKESKLEMPGWRDKQYIIVFYAANRILSRAVHPGTI